MAHPEGPPPPGRPPPRELGPRERPGRPGRALNLAKGRGPRRGVGVSGDGGKGPTQAQTRHGPSGLKPRRGSSPSGLQTGGRRDAVRGLPPRSGRGRAGVTAGASAPLPEQRQSNPKRYRRAGSAIIVLGRVLRAVSCQEEGQRRGPRARAAAHPARPTQRLNVSDVGRSAKSFRGD